uniref:Uncharacterized protein n=1 Tax=Romanomermis culicivorax TaxID=13658 RepID=A0A915JH97_ROMCU
MDYNYIRHLVANRKSKYDDWDVGHNDNPGALEPAGQMQPCIVCQTLQIFNYQMGIPIPLEF